MTQLKMRFDMSVRYPARTHPFRIHARRPYEIFADLPKLILKNDVPELYQVKIACTKIAVVFNRLVKLQSIASV